MKVMPCILDSIPDGLHAADRNSVVSALPALPWSVSFDRGPSWKNDTILMLNNEDLGVSLNGLLWFLHSRDVALFMARIIKTIRKVERDTLLTEKFFACSKANVHVRNNDFFRYSIIVIKLSK